MRKFILLVIVTVIMISPFFNSTYVHSDSPYILNIKSSSGSQIRSIVSGDTITNSDLINNLEIESCDSTIYKEIEIGGETVSVLDSNTKPLYTKKIEYLVNDNKIAIKFNKITGGSDTVTINLLEDSNNSGNGTNEPGIPYKLTIKGTSEAKEISNGGTVKSSDLNSKFEITACNKEIYNGIEVKLADGTTQNVSNLSVAPIFSAKISNIIFNNKITLNFKKINGGSDTVTINYVEDRQLPPYEVQIINKNGTKKVENGLKINQSDLDGNFEITSCDGTKYSSINISNANGKTSTISNLIATPVFRSKVSEIVSNNKITITFNKKSGGSDIVSLTVVNEQQEIPLLMVVKKGSNSKKIVNDTKLTEEDLDGTFEITTCDYKMYSFIDIKQADGKVTRITNLTKSPVYTARVSDLIFEDKISITFKKVDGKTEVVNITCPKSMPANEVKVAPKSSPIISDTPQPVMNADTKNKVMEITPYVLRQKYEPTYANKIIWSILTVFVLGAFVFVPGPLISKGDILRPFVSLRDAKISKFRKKR